MIEFAWPLAVLALPLPLLVRRLPALQRPEPALRVPQLERFSGLARTTGGPPRSRPAVTLLSWAVWLALVVALTRPQWLGDPVELPMTGRDLLLAVDVSGSMNSDDMAIGQRKVNRLEAVKHVVGQFLQRRAGDRVGLILFGTEAYLQAPLTFDHRTVGQLLDEAPVGIAGGKTAVGDAIGLAVKRLRERPAQNRVLVLLTDGASNVGELEPLTAARLAAEEGVTIYTIGVGAEEIEQFSLFFGSRLVNPSADLDEDTLRAIAAATGGQYFRARATAELEQIYARLDELEPIEADPDRYRPVVPMYPWPLGVALFGSLLLAALQTRPGAAA